jgi:hypothetical protein
VIEVVAASVVIGALLMVPITLLRVRSKIRRQEAWFTSPTVDQEQPPLEITNRWQYVATTLGEENSTRIWAYGLWQRGWCVPLLLPGELKIVRRGADSILIERQSILRLVSDNATVGRGVETGGLVGIVWKKSGVLLTTWLRAISPSEQLQLKSALASGVL